MLNQFPAERLKALRKKAMLTQMQVVEQTGISEATLCYLERGDRRPQTRTLEKLLNLYATRINWVANLEKIFTGDPNANGSLSSQAPVGNRSPGFDRLRTAQAPQPGRALPVAHGVPGFPRRDRF